MTSQVKSRAIENHREHDGAPLNDRGQSGHRLRRVIENHREHDGAPLKAAHPRPAWVLARLGPSAGA